MCSDGFHLISTPARVALSQVQHYTMNPSFPLPFPPRVSLAPFPLIHDTRFKNYACFLRILRHVLAFFSSHLATRLVHIVGWILSVSPPFGEDSSHRFDRSKFDELPRWIPWTSIRRTKSASRWRLRECNPCMNSCIFPLSPPTASCRFFALPPWRSYRFFSKQRRNFQVGIHGPRSRHEDVVSTGPKHDTRAAHHTSTCAPSRQEDVLRARGRRGGEDLKETRTWEARGRRRRSSVWEDGGPVHQLGTRIAEDERARADLASFAAARSRHSLRSARRVRRGRIRKEKRRRKRPWR